MTSNAVDFAFCSGPRRCRKEIVALSWFSRRSRDWKLQLSSQFLLWASGTDASIWFHTHQASRSAPQAARSGDPSKELRHIPMRRCQRPSVNIMPCSKHLKEWLKIKKAIFKARPTTVVLFHLSCFSSEASEWIDSSGSRRQQLPSAREFQLGPSR